MTTIQKRMMFLLLSVLLALPVGLGCNRASSQGVRKQPLLRTDRPHPQPRPASRARAQRSPDAALMQGTPEYEETLEELTDINVSGLNIRTQCRLRNGKPDCRECIKAIQQMGMKPATPPRGRGPKRKVVVSGPKR